jgi:hypothetical protein
MKHIETLESQIAKVKDFGLDRLAEKLVEYAV